MQTQAASPGGTGTAAPAVAGPDAPIVQASDVAKTYLLRTGSVHALDGVTFRVRRGEFLSLLGPSGCGKSTLLRILAGLTPASSGEITLEGRPVAGPQTQVGMVFQRPVLLEWRTALDNVLLQAEARRLNRATARQRALELLGSVGLTGFEHVRPQALSGGMQQRVAICRALLHDPRILLMDEPFGALDALTRDQMAIDLQRLWRQGEKTVVFVTHSIDEAVFLSDRVLIMTPRPGRIDLDLSIDLPRPRRVAMKESPEFATYSHQIREALAARGVLREDE